MELKLFMGKFEQQAIDNFLVKPFIWWRFMDDIFMIWTHGEEHLKSFIGFLNSIHPSIKFTHEYSNSLHQTLPFLDVQAPVSSTTTSKQISKQSPQTNINTSSKHRATYPNHTKKAIPFSFFLRIRCIYVLPTLSLTNEAETSSGGYLTKRGYNRNSLHYILGCEIYVTQPFNRRNRNPPRLTEHPLSHPSTLRYLKYHLLSSSIPLSFNPLPTAKKPSLTHQL